jgi:hypothetical protein
LRTLLFPVFHTTALIAATRRGDVFLEEGDRETYCGFLSDCAAKAS